MPWSVDANFHPNLHVQVVSTTCVSLLLNNPPFLFYRTWCYSVICVRSAGLPTPKECKRLRILGRTAWDKFYIYLIFNLQPIPLFLAIFWQLLLTFSHMQVVDSRNYGSWEGGRRRDVWLGCFRHRVWRSCILSICPRVEWQGWIKTYVLSCIV